MASSGIGHVFPGNLSHGQAFISLEDTVAAFEQLVERRAALPVGETLLIGEPETPSYGELQREFARLIHGEEWTTDPIPKAIAKAGAWLEQHVPGEQPFIKPWMIDIADDHFELDISRARHQLGWHPKRSLRAALPRMIEQLKADPAGWYHENKLELPRSLEASAPSERRAS